MRRLLVLTSLLAVALAPPASAAAPEGRPCGWLLVGGERWDGVLHGGPVSAPGSVVHVRCEVVTPSGTVLATSDSGPRDDLAATADLVSFAAGDERLCTYVTVDGAPWQWRDGGWAPGEGTCAGASTTVEDLLTTCMSLDCGPLGFTHGLLNDTVCTTTGGDFYVAGELFWDCAPYEVT